MRFQETNCHSLCHNWDMAIIGSKLNQTPWTEAEFVSRLRRNEFLFPPVKIEWVNTGCDLPASNPDDKVEISWENRKSKFVFEYKSASTPKVLETAVAQAQKYAKEFGLFPLVVVPYLSEKSLQFLESEKVSGIDLSGNGTIFTPVIAVRRSGMPNQFREAAPIRNIFKGNSSLIARCFLLRSEYSSSTDLQSFAASLFYGKMNRAESIFAKGTVSKVTQALIEEKIISRSACGLRLTDPKMLLYQLKSNYQMPRGERIEGKTLLREAEIWIAMKSDDLRAIVTGEGSAGHYRILSGQEKLTLYVDDLQRARESLQIKPGQLFPNVELIEDKNDLRYFDARPENRTLWASPIQTWMELANSGSRERAAAGELETLFEKGKGGTL